VGRVMVSLRRSIMEALQKIPDGAHLHRSKA